MGGEVNEEPIAQHLLKKYIMYARNHVRPQLHNIDTDKVSTATHTYIHTHCPSGHSVYLHQRTAATVHTVTLHIDCLAGVA
jgi:DNA replicative helicase MCM subunit Mcm2 (Cdc46/Mcm family)